MTPHFTLAALSTEMEIRRLPLLRVHPNPWQTRTADDDPAHTADLAESIRSQGLLQIPTGRPHPQQPGHVELAFGHSRLAAFCWLNDPAAADGWDPAAYSEFPVVVRDLTDREMSDLAAAENARRRNLTAIETAQALQRRIKDFRLTHAEAGAPFGLSASAVSNLLRLLNLPDAVQQQVAAGEVPERLARQLVNVARADPKAAERIALTVSQAAPAERENALADAMAAYLHNKLSLDYVIWRDNWLADRPYPLADWPPAIDAAAALESESGHAVSAAFRGAREAGLDELRDCGRCPHRLVYGSRNYCSLGACFAAKNALARWQAARRVSDRFKIPLAGRREKAIRLNKALGDYGISYIERDQIRALLRRPDAATDLGLRVVTDPQESWVWEDVLKEKAVSLATTNLAAVKRAVKEKPKKAGAPARRQAPTPAQDDAQREREEREREQRRAERAAKQRDLHDVAWLVQHAARRIAGQLAISGGVLRYVLAERRSFEREFVRAYPGLLHLVEDLAQQADREKLQAEADGLRRQALVVNEILRHVFDYSLEHALRHEPGGAWRHVRDGIAALAGSGGKVKRNFNFGASLSPGWDRPPIHRTPYNCWQCGKFTGAERVTQRDQAAGWIVAGKPEKPDGVWCSEAHRAEFVRASGKVAAPKATAKKGKRK